ncbi:MAG: alpha-mannosidase [Clostridia bacterium]|nr:alpha-mannosidase [Clostridia bacterium]
MEGFIEREMVALNQIEERVSGHKEWLMSKKRCRYSFEEITKIKIGELRQKIYKVIIPCEGWVKREAYYRGVNDYEYTESDYTPIAVGEHWGGHDLSCFFKNTIVIPENMDGEKVSLQIFLGGDSLLYVNGEPYQGLDPFRNAVILSDCAKAGDVYELYIESYCYHTPGAEGNGVRTFECSSLTAIDKEIEKIYWDYTVALNMLAIPDMDENLRAYLADAVDEAVSYIDTDNDDEFYKKLKTGEKILREKIFESGKFLKNGQVHLIGHSHLDVVYLWEYKEFVRKVGRTHATMLKLLDENPDFIFSQSQALIYKEMRDNYPELFERVKSYVKEGRWEIIGAMWVEPDCNLISGESFVRQIMMGRRFFKKEFDVVPETCWLPDVFGNSYGLPQILAKSGIKYFVTHKPCVWNDTNPWTKHTFRWESADGSSVFAVLSPTHFVGTCEPNHVMDNWNKFSDKTLVGESLYCYGWGDGGGGVSPDMIENARRIARVPGMPGTKMIRAEDALASMEAHAGELPVLKGEIYLEAHRGVHTNRSILKRLNRRCENLYREAEMFSVVAQKYGFDYPAEELDKGWETVLTNQFHDILPGTHVKEAAADVMKEYGKAIALGERIKNDALSLIASNISCSIEGRKIAVFSSLETKGGNLAYLDETGVEIRDDKGNVVPSQVIEDFQGNRKTVFYAKDLPAVGYRVYTVTAGEDKDTAALICDRAENRYFSLHFADNGEIDEFIDKREERNILKNKGNVFKMYQDVPSRYDMWDIVYDYKDRPVDLPGGKIIGAERGDVFTAVIIEKKMLSSVLRQKVILYNELDRVDFLTWIDWHENKKLLKVGFDVDIAADKYTCDIAYSSIDRPNNRFTSYEEAKFEVCAHNWIDMSEEGYGISILNDGKYGYDVTGSVMSISLLKAASRPDDTADRGEHQFTYSVYPHKNSWKRGGTVTAARALNNPPGIVEISGDGNDRTDSFISVNHDNLLIEAVKESEDKKGIIVRVLEKCGVNTKAEVSLYAAPKKAYECDLMENVTGDCAADTNKIKFRIGAYEVKTFKIEL